MDEKVSVALKDYRGPQDVEASISLLSFMDPVGVTLTHGRQKYAHSRLVFVIVCPDEQVNSVWVCPLYQEALFLPGDWNETSLRQYLVELQAVGPTPD